ncbi:hypothetical protein ACFFWD_07965 [Bradyrhizobium erythrophlei]|uniref:hypothetical protein n=1 Tax=Bradyrhizobium erythrophlei TaxID=1437360 RepID=UPI0035F037C1
MNALIPGSQRRASAAVRQQQYQDLKDTLRSRGQELPRPTFRHRTPCCRKQAWHHPEKRKIQIRRTFELLAHAGQDHRRRIERFAQLVFRRRWRTHSGDVGVEWNDHALRP